MAVKEAACDHANHALGDIGVGNDAVNNSRSFVLEPLQARIIRGGAPMKKDGQTQCLDLRKKRIGLGRVKDELAVRSRVEQHGTKALSCHPLHFFDRAFDILQRNGHNTE